jgi:tRNA splicing endonuclease
MTVVTRPEPASSQDATKYRMSELVSSRSRDATTELSVTELRLVFEHIESNVDIRRYVLYTARMSAITMSPP